MNKILLKSLANATENIDFWGKLISKNYPLNPYLINTFNKKLNFYNISQNKTINWNESLINRFESELNLPLLFENDSIDNEIIDFLFPKLISKKHWMTLSSSKRVFWNQELIEKYKENFVIGMH